MKISSEMESHHVPDVKKESFLMTSEDVDRKNEKTSTDSADEEDPREAARVAGYQSRPFFRRYFLECILALYTVATVLYYVPVNTVMNDKSCLYVYGYNRSLCAELQNARDDVKNPVLAYTNAYSTFRDCVINIPGGLAAIVAGNYLTRYGFRTPLIATLAGGTIACICQLLTVLIMPTPVVFNALAELPGSIPGGPIVIMTAVYTNIAFRVPQPLQLHRITVTSFVNGVSALIAIFSGAKLAEVFGMEILMIFCATLLMISTVVVIFLLEDIDVPEKNKEDTWCESLWLSLRDGLKTSINAVSQKRPERKRTQIICVLICLASTCNGIPATSNGFAIAYTRSVMDYDPFEFTLYSGATMVLAFACLFPMVALSKKLKLSPPVLIAGGSISFLLRLVSLALTEFFRPLFYLQIILGTPYVIAPLSIINYLTSLVDKSEVSVVMALSSLIEKFVPLATGSLGSYVYKLTSDSFPGCFYLILAFVYLIPIGLSLYCRMILSWNERQKQEMTHL